jgi:hypothetical protein
MVRPDGVTPPCGRDDGNERDNQQPSVAVTKIVRPVLGHILILTASRLSHNAETVGQSGTSGYPTRKFPCPLATHDRREAWRLVAF